MAELELIKALAAKIIGKDPSKVEEIWLYLVNLFGTSPIILKALSAIDIALWDIKVKKLNLPLGAFLGSGKDKVSVHYSTPNTGWKQEDILDLPKNGITSALTKIAPEEVFKVLAVKKTNSHFNVMVEPVSYMNVSEAIRMVNALQPADISWIVEPMRVDNLSSYEKLASVSPIPIAVGKSLGTLTQFREFLQRGACSVLEVNPDCIGGITPFLKVVHLAESFSVSVVSSSALELSAALCPAFSNIVSVDSTPLFSNLIKSNITVQQGYVVCPTSPGVGITVDVKVLEEFNVLKPPPKPVEQLKFEEVPSPKSKKEAKKEKEQAKLTESAKKEAVAVTVAVAVAEPPKEEPKP